jgi:hypothetical protein
VGKTSGASAVSSVAADVRRRIWQSFVGSPPPHVGGYVGVQALACPALAS